jgi:tRNA pseudouridine38-40 synthase
MRYAVKFAYDGTKFSGSQRQPRQNIRTVEGDIIDYLIKHQIINDHKSSKFQVASRTDTGVSALGNVLTFNSDFTAKDILNILNSRVDDCWFYGICQVDENFKPRFAKSRWYRYYSFKDKKIDFEKLKSIIELFIGEHDFRNFAKPGIENTLRTIDTIEIENRDRWIIFDLKAPGFLWNQVRRLVSGWIQYAKGEIKREELEGAINNPDKSFDFGLAAAEPLVLMDVEYDFEFEINKKNLRKTKAKLINEWQGLFLKSEFFNQLLGKF